MSEGLNRATEARNTYTFARNGRHVDIPLISEVAREIIIAPESRARGAIEERRRDGREYPNGLELSTLRRDLPRRRSVDAESARFETETSRADFSSNRGCDCFRSHAITPRDRARVVIFRQPRLLAEATAVNVWRDTHETLLSMSAASRRREIRSKVSPLARYPTLSRAIAVRRRVLATRSRARASAHKFSGGKLGNFDT